MSTFERAIIVILAHEGGFSNNPRDPGGITNFGISLRYLLTELAHVHDADGHIVGDLNGDGHVDAGDIRGLTREQACEIYRGQWWEKYGYGRVLDQQCATKVFDCAVNMGPRRAHLFAQRSANACGYSLIEDATLGPKSIQAINACEAREWLLEYTFQMTDRYRAIADNNPDLECFRVGWLRRASWPFYKDAYVA